MKRKFKIISTLTTMVAVMLTMCVGILAAKKVSFAGNSTLSFSATDVFATVTIQEQIGDAASNTVFSQKTYNGSTSSGEENLSETVSFSAFTFAKATDQIVITVTVKNDFTESTSIDVHLAATVESDENQLIVIETSENLESGSDTIQSGASETYTVTLSLSEKAQQQGVSQLTFSFDLSLSRTASSD